MRKRYARNPTLQIRNNSDFTHECISLSLNRDSSKCPKVGLEGKTISGAESLLRELYDRDYLVNPQINIVVLEYSRRTVNVLGSVGEPGEIDFPKEEGLTILDAISRAGGFSRLADRRKIKLTRKLESGRVETFIINADELIEGGSEKRWVLQTDDLVYVPERFL